MRRRWWSRTPRGGAKRTLPEAAWLPVIIIVLGLVVGVLPAWAEHLGSPLRQTVPMTPPPTWTPVATLGAPDPTRPSPPTRAADNGSDDSQPTDEPPTAIPPTATTVPTVADTPLPATATVVALTPTVVASRTPVVTETTVPTATLVPVVVGEPWQWLSAKPLVVGPGSQVVVLYELHNIGDGPLQAQVDLLQPAGLRFVNWSAGSGEAAMVGETLHWQPGVLPVDEGATLTIEAMIADDVLPNGTIVLQAAVDGPQGTIGSNVCELTLPWALLPQGLPIVSQSMGKSADATVRRAHIGTCVRC